MNYYYTLYGLVIQFPFQCGIIPEASLPSHPDVVVGLGHVPQKLDRSIVVEDSWFLGYCWEVAPQQYLFKGGDFVGRYLVENGERITIQLHQESIMEKVIYHLLHSVLAALLRQRGILVFHADAASFLDKAVVISGMSGAGKSSTLAALLKQGYQMLANDITVIKFNSFNQIVIYPGVSQIQICQDTAKQLGIDDSLYSASPVRKEKIIVPVSKDFSEDSVPLKSIYFLEISSKSTLEIISLAGQDKFNMLLDCIYGPLLQEEHSQLFKIFSAICREVEMFRILRPKDQWSLNEIVKHICNHNSSQPYYYV